MMPDRRKHRGAGPEDDRLFSGDKVADMRRAVHDHSMLLSMGYGEVGSLKLICDRFSLTSRQRMAVIRSSCSDMHLEGRLSRQLAVSNLAGRSVIIDGYNLLISLEAAISGGYLFIGRDGCYRDISGVHGTYRKVEETVEAIELAGEHLAGVGVEKVLWLLDSPVSNSGKLKKLMVEISRERGWGWMVDVVMNPDMELFKSDMIVVSSDSVVLDKCSRWSNLCRSILRDRVADASVVDLCG